jgi:hypothetical protein
MVSTSKSTQCLDFTGRIETFLLDAPPNESSSWKVTKRNKRMPRRGNKLRPSGRSVIQKEKRGPDNGIKQALPKIEVKRGRTSLKGEGAFGIAGVIVLAAFIFGPSAYQRLTSTQSSPAAQSQPLAAAQSQPWATISNSHITALHNIFTVGPQTPIPNITGSTLEAGHDVFHQEAIPPGRN